MVDAPLDTTVVAPAGTVIGTTDGGVAVKQSGVVEGQPAEAVDFKAAGRSFLAGLAAGTVAVPGAAPATAAAAAPVKTTTVGGVEVALEAGADDDDAGTLSDTDALAFDKPVVDPAAAAAEVAVDPDAPAPGEEAAAGDPGFVRVTLPGLTERGETDMEADVSPELAERIERLRNDGLRRSAYNEAMKEVADGRAELAAVTQALEVDPVGFAMNHMTKERQIEVAKALVLEHFDALLPDLVKYDQDPAARQGDRVTLRDKMKESGERMRTTTEVQRRAADVFRAVDALLPENLDPKIANAFRADAARDLIDEVNAGRPVAPEAVGTLLSRRLELYGLTATSAPAARTTPVAPAAAVTARPVTDAAKAIADKVKAASVAQARVANTQTARRSAAAIAPPGAGAATVSVPVVSQTADIREASRELRKKGVGSSWAPT